MKRDKQAFSDLWHRVAVPQFEKLQSLNFLSISPDAEEMVNATYSAFNRYCSENYMMEATGLLDRHKVAACLIYGIVKVSPISVSRDYIETCEDMRAKLYYVTINERVAIMIAASTLVSYIIARHVEGIESESERTEIENGLMEKFSQGIPFDLFAVNHGENYLDNLAVTLYYTKCEENYNILLLANTVYHWELAACRKFDIAFE